VEASCTIAIAVVASFAVGVTSWVQKMNGFEEQNTVLEEQVEKLEENNEKLKNLPPEIIYVRVDEEGYTGEQVSSEEAQEMTEVPAEEVKGERPGRLRPL